MHWDHHTHTHTRTKEKWQGRMQNAKKNTFQAGTKSTRRKWRKNENMNCCVLIRNEIYIVIIVIVLANCLFIVHIHDRGIYFIINMYISYILGWVESNFSYKTPKHQSPYCLIHGAGQDIIVEIEIWDIFMHYHGTRWMSRRRTLRIFELWADIDNHDFTPIFSVVE